MALPSASRPWRRRTRRCSRGCRWGPPWSRRWSPPPASWARPATPASSPAMQRSPNGNKHTTPSFLTRAFRRTPLNTIPPHPKKKKSQRPSISRVRIPSNTSRTQNPSRIGHASATNRRVEARYQGEGVDEEGAAAVGLDELRDAPRGANPPVRLPQLLLLLLQEQPAPARDSRCGHLLLLLLPHKPVRRGRRGREGKGEGGEARRRRRRRRWIWLEVGGGGGDWRREAGANFGKGEERRGGWRRGGYQFEACGGRRSGRRPGGKGWLVSLRRNVFLFLFFILGKWIVKIRPRLVPKFFSKRMTHV